MNDGPRIVSLLASATEIVASLGLAQYLVGRSHECDFPPGVRALPVLTEPRIATDRASALIDRDIKAILAQALSVYRVDGAQLQLLQPDVIVTQTQCEVCAVSLGDVEQALAEWTGARPSVVSLQPNGLADVWEDIRRVAAALDAPQRADSLLVRLRRRIDAIAAAVPQQDRRPSVACIEWIEPLMAAGNWVPELVALAGGQNLFGIAGRHSPWMSWAELVAADPEIILVLPCGFDIARSRAEMPALTQRPEWRQLRAVRNSAVFLCDGNQYFNRPGPRLVESLEILGEILHPRRFDFGHRGRGWEAF
jgi:iron complex transport system substrate-binding protein